MLVEKVPLLIFKLWKLDLSKLRFRCFFLIRITEFRFWYYNSIPPQRVKFLICPGRKRHAQDQDRRNGKKCLRKNARVRAEGRGLTSNCGWRRARGGQSQEALVGRQKGRLRCRGKQRVAVDNGCVVSKLQAGWHNSVRSLVSTCVRAWACHDCARVCLSTF